MTLPAPDVSAGLTPFEGSKAQFPPFVKAPHSAAQKARVIRANGRLTSKRRAARNCRPVKAATSHDRRKLANNSAMTSSPVAAFSRTGCTGIEAADGPL